jgi:Fe-S cluster biogenesis protein NfuA
MAEDAEFQKRVQRIGELVAQLETAADPNSRALAKDLVESLMALHGGALERMLEIASEAGDPGESIIRKCGRDELVSSVLLLYGLHPEDMRTRVSRALEKSHDFLAMHSAKAELVSIREDGTVTVRLELKSSGGCGSSGALVKSTLEAAIQNAAPDATTIVVEEAGALLTQSGFVSIAQLKASGPAVASFAAQAEQSGG